MSDPFLPNAPEANRSSAAPPPAAPGYLPPLLPPGGAARTARLCVLLNEEEHALIQAQNRLAEIRAYGVRALSVYDRTVAFSSGEEALGVSLPLLQNQIAAAKWLIQYCRCEIHRQLSLFDVSA